MIKSIKILNEENSQKAFALAKKILYAYCKENHLLRNEYRFCEDFDGIYIEITAGKTMFTCDSDYLHIVEQHL